ncbi:DUF3080 domain-containing protein [Marinobacter sp. F4206]|uniref:DUF3080 domain-containing protein n=1 Tax=Marinobacter sp. F4206 TaxID=2861777 RepID=UPI001C5D6D4C|nr:DUF3080 domain-containing protein [Marinobacter sp. F4206]MBW4936575.1 DUF3080 domain-containing protein [Marinobacter sp. F4206]
MPGVRWIRILVSGLFLALLSGCNPFSEARPMMDEYVERVARVLETEPGVTAIESPSQIPRRRNRVLPMPELDMGMLDFLSLYGCELQFVVGEKNSVMGKVMQPLNRLRYELRFIEAAQDCLPETDDEELVEALEEAIESKRESLPIAIWNATWGVEEIETLFTLAKGYYPVSPKGNPVSDLALDANELKNAVVALRSGTLEVSLEFAGSVQQRWQAEYRAGQLINSAALLKTRLDDATALIQGRVNGRPLCLNGKPNNQSEIVQSMFFSVYIEKIQPYMSDVRRARMTLIEPLAALAGEQRSVMPSAFESWYQRHLSQVAENSLWRELDEAMSRHTRAWQNLLGQCGLRPGA